MTVTSESHPEDIPRGDGILSHIAGPASGGEQGQVTSDPALDRFPGASLVSGMPGFLLQNERVKLNLDLSNARASASFSSIRGMATVRLGSGHPHLSLDCNGDSEPSTQGLLSAHPWVNKGAVPMHFPLAQPPPWPDFDRPRE